MSVSSLVAHLSAVAESRVRIPAPCKYYKAASAVRASAAAEAAEAAEAANNRKGQRPHKYFEYNANFT